METDDDRVEQSVLAGKQYEHPAINVTCEQLATSSVFPQGNPTVV